jgi:hypothetical protein
MTGAPEYSTIDSLTFIRDGQAKAWMTLWTRLAQLDPTLMETTGQTGIQCALASFDRLVGEIPKLRQQVAEAARHTTMAEVVFDGHAVLMELKNDLRAIGIKPEQVSAVLDAVARVARQRSKQ